MVELNPGKVQQLKYQSNVWANKITGGIVEIVEEEPTEADLAEAALLDEEFAGEVSNDAPGDGGEEGAGVAPGKVGDVPG